MNNTRGKDRTIGSRSREGGGDRTPGGGGVTGRPGSSGRSNSSQPSLHVKRQKAEDDDATLPPSSDTSQESSIALGGGEVVATSGQISHLDPDSLWFSDNKVIGNVSDAIKKHYLEQFMNWTETPQYQKDQWFNIFRKGYTWRPDLDGVVRKAFNSRAAKCLKDLVSQVEKSGETLGWMSENGYKRLRDDPNIIMRSNTALKNKREGDEDDRVVLGHRNGSISTVELVEQMTRENAGVRPTPIEIFERSRAVTKPIGETVYVSRKAQSTMETYQRTVAENDQQGVVKGVENVSYDAVGLKKGQVYELDQSADIFYENSISSGQSADIYYENSVSSGQSADTYYENSVSSGQSTATSHNPGTTELEERMETNEKEVAAMGAELEKAMDIYYEKNVSSGQSTAASHNPAITELEERMATNEKEVAAMGAGLDKAMDVCRQNCKLGKEMYKQIVYLQSIIHEKGGSNFTPSQPHHNPDGG